MKSLLLAASIALAASAASAAVPTGVDVSGDLYYKLTSDGRVVQVADDCKAPALYNDADTRAASCLFAGHDSDGADDDK